MITREKALEFVTRKVAKIIYDTVECSLPDRADSDWREAERIVNDGFAWMVGRMIGQPEAGDEFAHRYRDWALADDCSFEEFEWKLGEYVWKNAQFHRQNLPRPPYGRITFQ